MLISSKGQYALRLMVDISINSGSTVTVKAVARRCGLSDKYLEQVTSSLLKAGYLRSVRGPRGGYRLNMPAEEITVGMVLRAIEGRISPIDNRVDEDGDTNMVMNDVIGEVWDDLESAINNVLDNKPSPILPGSTVTGSDTCTQYKSGTEGTGTSVPFWGKKALIFVKTSKGVRPLRPPKGNKISVEKKLILYIVVVGYISY